MTLAELYDRYRPKNPEQFLYLFSMLVSRLVNRRRDPQTVQARTILVAKYDEIGDVVLGLHVFDLLKRRWPGATVTAFCKPYTRAVLEAVPAVDRVISSEDEFAAHYDVIVELRGTWRSAWYALTHPPLYRVDRGAVRWHNRRSGHRHEVEVNRQIVAPLLREPGEGVQPVLHPAEEHRRWAEAYIAEASLGRFAVLHPAARKPLKRWPPAHYAALADALYRERGWTAVLVGMEEDLPTLEEIRASASVPVHLLVDEPLMRVAALAARAEVFVGNDSGPMHLAAAVGAPVIGLFGPGSPELFHPVGPQAAYIHHKLPCNPCDQVHCVHPQNPCMQRITVEEVIGAMKSRSSSTD